MSIRIEQSQEQRTNHAARIGAIFDLPDAGSKITRDGVSMEPFGDGVMLSVVMVSQISKEESEAILNGLPLSHEASNG